MKAISFDDLLATADESLKLAVVKVKSLKAEGRIAEAIDLLLDLGRMYPGEKSVFIALGHLYWIQDNLSDASSNFRTATELDPLLELASLCLYHTLWSSGRQEEALVEMKRFLQVSQSEEYDRILKAFNEADLETESN